MWYSRGRPGSTAHDRAVEDQPDLVRSSEVEVLAQDFLEQHPTRDRPVQHLGQGALDLQHRDVVAVARDPIGPGERVRQGREPLRSSASIFASLRTETTINDSRDLNIGKRLCNLPELAQVGFSANRRLLDVERLSSDPTIGENAFRAVTHPIVVDH